MQRKSSESVLIDLARQSLVEFFAGGEKEDQEFPVDDETVSGVFITLKRDGMLRGCRGCVPSPENYLGAFTQQRLRRSAI